MDRNYFGDCCDKSGRHSGLFGMSAGNSREPEEDICEKMAHKVEPSPNGLWGLHYGIHRGTLTSRDSTLPTWEYGSVDECRAALKRHMDDFYTGIGCFIWFAYAIAPDGTKYRIARGADYQ